MNRLRSDRGQAAVLTVIFLAALLGAVAMVLDVGSWFRAQRGAQSAADAAALAGAQALPDTPGTATAFANEYLAKNGGGTAQITMSSARRANDTVTVRVTRQAPGTFAKLFGIDSVDVHAKASARVGSLAQAKWAAPFTVDELHPLLQCRPRPCFGQNTRLEADKVGPGAWHWLNIDGSRGGTGVPTLEQWIRYGMDGYMPLGWYYSMPGGKRSVDDALASRIGTELLLPLYRSVRGNGANLEYEVVGWVGFHLTGFSLQGAKTSWLDGYFTRVIWEGIISESGANFDYGVRAVELVE